MHYIKHINVCRQTLELLTEAKNAENQRTRDIALKRYCVFSSCVYCLWYMQKESKCLVRVGHSAEEKREAAIDLQKRTSRGWSNK